MKTCRRSLKRLSFAALLSMGTPAIAEEASPEDLVNGLNAVFGQHKARASHAKGVCVKGEFTPSAEASALSKAPHFAKTVPALGRFSVGGGNPKASDKAKSARGLALRFDLGGGESSDLVLVSAPIHFAQTPEQMIGFFNARLPGPDGKPDPAKVKAFTEANPVTGKQGAFIASRPVPASYASVNYWGVHAFGLADAAGKIVNVKFKALPAGGETGLSEEEAKAKPEDFLAAELSERLAKGPAAFDLVAFIGQEGDSLTDPTVEWPETERKMVKLGAISIAAIEPNATCDAIIFDPSNLPGGVSGPVGDPIFDARSPAYAISQSRRAN